MSMIKSKVILSYNIIKIYNGIYCFVAMETECVFRLSALLIKIYNKQIYKNLGIIHRHTLSKLFIYRK